MDKRGTRILISCIACAVIVLVLFIIAFRFARLTCELIEVEPVHLRRAQLDWFENQKRHKPTRSHDKLILMKISAYIEYNIAPKPNERKDSEDQDMAASQSSIDNSSTRRPVVAQFNASGGQGTTKSHSQLSALSLAGTTSGNLAQSQTQAQTAHPSPSHPQLGPIPAPTQFGASSNQTSQTQNPGLGAGYASSRAGWPNGPASSVAHWASQRAEKRFLPLALESIETRSVALDAPVPMSSSVNNILAPNSAATSSSATRSPSSAMFAPVSKQKFILSFNCTKLNMVMVYQGNRVWVESMSLELKPTSRSKSTCELQLPNTGAFAVDSSLTQVERAKGTPANLAHYFCNKPLTYNCYHYSSRSGPSQSNGLLLAELHINSIEFETITKAPMGKGDKKHVKHEFKGKRN